MTPVRIGQRPSFTDAFLKETLLGTSWFNSFQKRDKQLSPYCCFHLRLSLFLDGPAKLIEYSTIFKAPWVGWEWGKVLTDLLVTWSLATALATSDPMTQATFDQVVTVALLFFFAWAGRAMADDDFSPGRKTLRLGEVDSDDQPSPSPEARPWPKPVPKSAFPPPPKSSAEAVAALPKELQPSLVSRVVQSFFVFETM